jgi:8-amino-3,8-dideoxy-alpha-D-manno-octulosonate transaminase
MPGFEVFGKEEQDAINKLFELNGGVLFAHGFDAMRKGIFRVREFEKLFADRMAISHAQAVSSGSSALKVALKALDIKRGDEVIAPTFTFVATVEAILEAGATPVIADVNDTLNLCPQSFKNCITDKTKAVIPVHMMGAPAEMAEIMAIAEQHKLLVLEDNAQGCGGSYNGQLLGTIGHMGTYSFDAAKVIMTGEGGMVVTSDNSLYLRARAYHDHGHEYSDQLARGEENAVMTGFNYRMTELQATIGIVQLSKLKTILQKQRENKKRLKAILKDLPYKMRRLADEKGEVGDALIFYLETPENAIKFANKMRESGLGTKNLPDAIRWHFCKHWQHMFTEHGFHSDWMNRWEQSAGFLERAIALPVMVKMSDDQIEKTGETLLKIAKQI